MNIKEIYKNEIQGGEFDWFAIDLDGNIALFSTAGEGNVPNNVIKNYKDYDSISHSLEQPNWGSSGIWSDFANYGFYVFDWSLHGGPYIKVCEPKQRMSKELKDKILSINNFNSFDVRFATLKRLAFKIINSELIIKKD